MRGARCQTFIALGSNLGDSRQLLTDAMAELEQFSVEPIVRSSLWETTPVDCPPGSPLFLNAVAGLFPQETETPESLLARLQALEEKFGRRPKKVLNEARPLDLDLITFKDQVRTLPELTLPHPRAHLRRFVLEPLAEIAPDLLLPGQSLTVSALLSQLTSDEAVRKLG